MKTLVYTFLVFAFLSGNPVSANDEGFDSTDEYEFVYNNLLEIEKNAISIGISTMKQVIIYDSKGNIMRQIEIKEDPEIMTPAILKPLICNAEFLTKIDGTYYYRCN